MKRHGVALLCILCSTSFARNLAPGAPGIAFPWATSKKQGVGTAYEAYDRGIRYGNTSASAPISKVWYTIARGILTEVYYPRIDNPQSRDTQIVVTDGTSFLHQEQYDTVSAVVREPGSALYKILNKDKGGRYAIQKEIWADPDRDIVIQRIRIDRYKPGLKFFLLHKTAAANSIFGDSAEREPFIAGEDHPNFGGWQGITSSVPFVNKTVGYVGRSDGYADLSADFKLDYQFDAAPNGNVSMMAELPIPPTTGDTELSIFLVFGASRSDVIQKMAATRSLDLRTSQAKFIGHWKSYLSSLRPPVRSGSPAWRQRLAETSLVVLKSCEDKTYEGGLVASPSHPWGEKQVESGPVDPRKNTGYHAVWPRDVYHVANGFLSAGDTPTALAILNRLVAAQYQSWHGDWEFGSRRRNREGSFPQNFWVDGTAAWGGYQADETAMPILLAYRLHTAGLGLSPYWPMIKKAANFLAAMGPWTQNERWEENYGISPNSASYVISAMLAASTMAFEIGETALGTQWLSFADSWATKTGDNIDTWTFTTNGRIKGGATDGQYFLRLDGAGCRTALNCAPIWDALWNPNVDELFGLANFAGRYVYESDIVDGGFLSLVRLGVRAAKNPLIQASIPEIDTIIRKDTPRGPGWYRYRYDGYGENTKGRLWPLLSGERYHYELERKLEEGTFTSSSMEPYVRALEAFASPEGIFAEQVWDEGSAAGQPTDSASPLTWAHAEYLQLLRSVQDGRVFEEYKVVRDRYGKTARRK